MKENNIYLLKLWLIPILIGVVVVSGVLVNVARGNYFFLIVLLIPFVYWFAKGNPSKEIDKLLQQSSPEKLVDYYKMTIKPEAFENGDAYLAYTIALAYCYYGEFDNAVNGMKHIDWGSRPPLIQSLDLVIQSLISYLKNGDFTKGLMLARKARELATASGNFPGSNQSKLAYDAYVEIGQVLTGFSNPQVVNSLELKLKKSSHTLLKIPIAWGLACAYKNDNNMVKVEEMTRFCRTQAPFCNPFHVI